MAEEKHFREKYVYTSTEMVAIMKIPRTSWWERFKYRLNAILEYLGRTPIVKYIIPKRWRNPRYLYGVIELSEPFRPLRKSDGDG